MKAGHNSRKYIADYRFLILLTLLAFATGSLFLGSYFKSLPYTRWLYTPHRLDSSFSKELSPLNYVLHPQDHVFREAKKIEHDWVVTSGIRSPDGVEKRVYLISGMQAFYTHFLW
jgi:hypothetical protein